MKRVNLDSLFKINYGTDLELNKLELDPLGINFVSRTRKNNGVSNYVKSIDVKPNPQNTISVALGSSSVLFAFLQDKPYYSGRDIAYLVPIMPMTKQEMLFYCMCITHNRFRYNFGRQANKTINKLLVPSRNDIPEWVNTTKIVTPASISEKYIDCSEFSKNKFENIPFYDIFDNIVETTKSQKTNVNLVSAKTTDNGIAGCKKTDKYIDGNKITISSNGIYTGTAFYQQNAFITQDSLAFDLKCAKLNKYIAMYLVTIINMNRFKFNYGRKSGKNRLDKLSLCLPINNNGSPDYDFMENYIKSLPYSKLI